MSASGFEIGRVLDDLRSRCGDAQFGYRMQALFAHTLMRQGWTIAEINAQGHPDIRATLKDREVFTQVKSISHRSANTVIELSSADVTGITAMGMRAGWFAVLDCAAPVQWIMVERSRAARLLGQPLHLATLEANGDVVMSESCNEHFYEIIDTHRDKLRNLSYTVLRNRALAYNGL